MLTKSFHQLVPCLFGRKHRHCLPWSR
jgi:hypothetical protein